MRILVVLSLLFSMAAAAQDPDLVAIGKVIDGFHDAAAHGDKTRYLAHMTDDAVFMGTDEWERWPKNPDFADYVDNRFKDGTGWTYASVARNIQVSESRNFAWFDEVISSELHGRFRGTGVLAREQGEWKLAHYAMSFLILNENWPDVVELTRKTKAEKDKSDR